MNFQFVEKTNPNTNEVYHEAQFTAKLIGVNAENVLENSRKTKYILGSIEFENNKGNTVTSSTMIYLKNWEHGMTVGQSYLTSVRVTPGSDLPPLVITSHLTQAARATADTFGFNVSNVKSQVEADVLEG